MTSAAEDEDCTSRKNRTSYRRRVSDSTDIGAAIQRMMNDLVATGLKACAACRPIALFCVQCV